MHYVLWLKSLWTVETHQTFKELLTAIKLDLVSSLIKPAAII